MQIAVLASGNGSNFEAIVRASKRGEIKSQISVLIVDKKSSYAITRAKYLGVKYVIVELANFSDKQSYEQEIVNILKAYNIDFICLAGYMKIVSETLLSAYQGRIINIHPTLLPKYKGKFGFDLSLESMDEELGATVHHVNNQLDGGEIIDQIRFLRKGKTLEELEKELHENEHILYVRVIKEMEEK